MHSKYINCNCNYKHTVLKTINTVNRFCFNFQEVTCRYSVFLTVITLIAIMLLKKPYLYQIIIDLPIPPLTASE